jgi:hypothetical protein
LSLALQVPVISWGFRFKLLFSGVLSSCILVRVFL